MTGKELNAETTIEIGGVDVAFCCKNCQGAAKGKEGAEQLELVFGDKAFEKGFKIVKKTEAQQAQ